MNLHGSATRVSEDVGDTFAFESFDEDIGAFSGLVRSKSGNENFGIGRGGGSGESNGGNVGGGTWVVGLRERVGDCEVAAEREGGLRLGK